MNNKQKKAKRIRKRKQKHLNLGSWEADGLVVANSADPRKQP